MTVNHVSLEAVAVSPSQYPPALLPEFAFVGRSNVGKSSLINAMINRKSLARTSQSPGKTRTINFYNVESSLYFVDLPGYGYAKVSKSESQKWGNMIEKYLLARETLRSVFLLLDIRHEPSANDKMMYEWLLHYQKELVIIATKADKLNRSQVPAALKVIRGALAMTSSDSLLPFSSETKSGRDELWGLIENKM